MGAVDVVELAIGGLEVLDKLDEVEDVVVLEQEELDTKFEDDELHIGLEDDEEIEPFLDRTLEMLFWGACADSNRCRH